MADAEIVVTGVQPPLTNWFEYSVYHGYISVSPSVLAALNLSVSPNASSYGTSTISIQPVDSSAEEEDDEQIPFDLAFDMLAALQDGDFIELQQIVNAHFQPIIVNPLPFQATAIDGIFAQEHPENGNLALWSYDAGTGTYMPLVGVYTPAQGGQTTLQGSGGSATVGPLGGSVSPNSTQSYDQLPLNEDTWPGYTPPYPDF